MQRPDLVLPEVEHVAKHSRGIGAEFRGGSDRAVEAGAPRQAGQYAGTAPLPEPALGEMFAVDEVPRTGKSRRGNAGPQQFGLFHRGGSGVQPSSERFIDDCAAVLPLIQPILRQWRQYGCECAKVLPLLVGRHGEADPVVLAGAAVDAVRSVLVGSVAARLRRGGA